MLRWATCHSRCLFFMNKNQLQARFTIFVERLRAFSVLPEGERKEQAKALEGEYRALFGAFSKLSNAQTKACMAVADEVGARALAEHLFLGREQIRGFHRKLTSLNLFEKDAGRTDWAISEFVSRHAAYQLIHKRPATGRPDEETQRLVGAMLGVDGTELSEEFVKKVKGEMMGAVLAYAHAQLCDRDMERWEKDSKLRHHYDGQLGNYLTDCIQAANLPLFYRTGAEKDARQDIACVFVEHGTDMYSSAWQSNTAPAGQADAFCVNHEKKLLVVGGSTVNTKYNAKQLLSIARHTRALQFLVENDERYKGYQVLPFVFHGGYFSADPEAKDGAGIQFVSELRQAGMSQSHIEALARMPFFNLLAEEHQTEDLGKVFAQLNTHVAGCSTLDQFKALERVRAGEPRAGAIAALKALEQASEAMASNAFVLKDKKDDRRGSLLNGMAMALINFYVIFPVKPPAAISEEEQAIAERIGPHLRTIQQKITHGSGFSSLDFLYEKLAEQFLKKREFAKLVKTRSDISANKTQLVWSESLYMDLLKKKKVFDLNPAAVTGEVVTSVAGDLAKGTVPALLKAAVEHCLAVNEGLKGAANEGMTDGQTFLMKQVLLEAQALAVLAQKGKTVTPKERAAHYSNNTTFVQSLHNAIGNTEYKTLYDPTLRLTENTFRFARALFQMSGEQLKGNAPSVAMDRALPLFVRECLAADSNPGLQQLALAHIQGIRFEAQKAFRMGPKRANA